MSLRDQNETQEANLQHAIKGQGYKITRNGNMWLKTTVAEVWDEHKDEIMDMTAPLDSARTLQFLRGMALLYRMEHD